ncbi:MAG: hypothetical protein M5U34_01295 [Chloroflexi bacterium]|nr:hypothetical protein [Chloroflexota bacterium]
MSSLVARHLDGYEVVVVEKAEEVAHKAALTPSVGDFAECPARTARKHRDAGSGQCPDHRMFAAQSNVDGNLSGRDGFPDETDQF